jgi:hypothetical protein
VDSLFDAVERTNTSPGTHSEPMFTFLNRTKGARWERIRALMDEWWNQHPASARGSLRGRIRCGDNHAFMAAFFELYGYQVLRRVRVGVVEHRPTATGRQPDFLATAPDVPPLVLEMTSTGVSPAAKAKAARRSTIYDQINAWSFPNFWLRLDIEAEGTGNPPLRRLRRELDVWIASLDVDEIARAAQSAGYLSSEAAPRHVWCDSGWQIEFGVWPRSLRKRAPITRTIGIYGAEAAWANDVEPIRGRLADKASAYGDFDGPYVVAVLPIGLGTDDIDVGSALYGDEAVAFPTNDPEAAQLVRRPNGSWFKADGWHHTNVSAVLVVPQLLPSTVTMVVPTLWHHPAAKYPVDNIAPLFRQARPDTDTGHIEFSPPLSNPATFFDLPQDWPGPEPRFAED